MKSNSIGATPQRTSYDVVIIGGAIMGSSTAWFLASNPDFNGRVLVVERDPTYRFSSTALSNSCIRLQFSTALNVRISQFGADFFHSLRAQMGGDPRVPEMKIHNFGYLYLADTPDFADTLRANQQVQRAAGAQTEVLTRDEIAARYPFYALDDIVLGSINTKDEGYFDGGTLFDWWRRSARAQGVEYITNEVVAMTLDPSGTRVSSVTLATGAVIGCGAVVNAAGPHAAQTARMAAISVPIEPRKRYTWVFSARQPLDCDLPLTIDPTGVHVRQDGPKTYLAGSRGDPDPAVDPDDFAMDHDLWQSHVWPVIAARIPQFEAIRVVSEWVGHYAYNVLDQNAVLGRHDRVTNFMFLNGFSGHGLQQSPAMGRGMAELLTYGGFRTLDLSPFGYTRIARAAPLVEKAVI